MEKYLYIALFAPLVGSLFAAVFAMSKKISLQVFLHHLC